MLKRKNNKINVKNLLIVVGSFLILIGLSIILINIIKDKMADKKDNELLDVFYQNQELLDEIDNEDKIIDELNEDTEETNTELQNEQDYIAVLKIPKINLERGIVNKNSYYNDLKINVKILNESDLPDKEKGNVILASHTGTVRGSFFRRLDELEINDVASIIYNGKEYFYKVVNIYDVPKTGTAEIIRNNEKNTLTLISCRFKTDYQIIVICELVEVI